MERELRSGGYSDLWDDEVRRGIWFPGIYLVRLSADADESIVRLVVWCLVYIKKRSDEKK